MVLERLPGVVVVLLVSDGPQPTVPDASAQVSAIRFVEGLGPSDRGPDGRDEDTVWVC